MQVAFLPLASAAPMNGAAPSAPSQPEPDAENASFASLLDSSAGQTAGDDGVPTPKPGSRAPAADDTDAEASDAAERGLAAGLCPPMPVPAAVPAPPTTGAAAGATGAPDGPTGASVGGGEAPAGAVPAAETNADGRTAAEPGRAAAVSPLVRELSPNPKSGEMGAAAVPVPSPMTNDALEGGPKPGSPAPEMPVPRAAASRAFAEVPAGVAFAPTAGRRASASAAPKAPAAPVVATRTLAQVLCETARPSSGSIAADMTQSSTGAETPSVQTAPLPGGKDMATSPAGAAGAETTGRAPGATTTSAPVIPSAASARAVAGTTEVAPQENLPAGTVAVAKSRGSERGAPESPVKTDSAAVGDGATRLSPENPAARRVHGAADAAADAGRNGQRNFLNVGRQRVGESAPQFGTDVAKEAQPMPANATDLPPATHALSSDEPVVATVGAVAESSAAGTARVVADSSPARSVAAETIRQLQEVAARARETGRNQMDFQVRTSDDESLRVNLRWHDGVVHARFVSESAELQQALSREWALAAPRLAEKGLKFDQPSFEHHERPDHQSSAQDGSSFAQQRHSSRGQERDFELAGASGHASAPSLAAARPATTHNSGTPPADRSVPLPRPAAGVTNLRAWA